MQLDSIGNPIFSSRDLLEEIYKGNIDRLDKAKVYPDDDDYLKYLSFIKDNLFNDWPIPLPGDDNKIDIVTFDKMHQHSWKMPEEYKTFPVGLYLLSLCKTAEETNRVKIELELFKKHNMMDLLCFLKYLVDTMREKSILWGVGRGSSVASYCLYLLGIHKINSLKYNLDITEFLK